MNSLELPILVFLSFPPVVSLVCGAIVWFDFCHARIRPGHASQRPAAAVLTYFVISVCWFLLVYGFIFEGGRLFIGLFFAPLVVLVGVLIFSTIRTLTTDISSRMGRVHFIFPSSLLLFTILFALLSPPTPPIPYIMAALGVVGYLVSTLVLLVRFVRPRRLSRRSRPASGRRPCRVFSALFWSILVEVLVILSLAPALFLPRPLASNLPRPFASPLIELLVFLLIFSSIVIYVVLCFALLSARNLAHNHASNPVSSHTRVPGSRSFPGLTRERVEGYMSTVRPWLDPSFRLEEMCSDLFTNRAYVSSFINAEFGVNFSRFVNRYRLCEVDRQRAQFSRASQISRPSQFSRAVPTIQLVLNAGFSSYRSYLRARECEKKPPVGGFRSRCVFSLFFCKQSHDKQQHHCADHGYEQSPDESASANAKQSEYPSAEHGADDPDEQVDPEARSRAFNDHTADPTGDGSDEDVE